MQKFLASIMHQKVLQHLLPLVRLVPMLAIAAQDSVLAMYVLMVLLAQLATLARTQIVHQPSVEEMAFALMDQMGHLVQLALLVHQDHVQGIINVLMVL